MSTSHTSLAFMSDSSIAMWNLLPSMLLCDETGSLVGGPIGLLNWQSK